MWVTQSQIREAVIRKTLNQKVKSVKFALKQAMKAQRKIKCITLLFL